MMMSSISRISFSFSPLYFFNVLRMFWHCILHRWVGEGGNGSLKKLCNVEPPALIAAIPVGARMMCFFFVVAAI